MTQEENTRLILINSGASISINVDIEIVPFVYHYTKHRFYEEIHICFRILGQVRNCCLLEYETMRLSIHA